MITKPPITVLYFANASTVLGITSELVDLPTVPFELSSLRELLVSRHPNTGLDVILESSQWSVDEEMVFGDMAVSLTGGEEVAVICPVSGG
ncbi:hypothetical protein AMATHDRAFT_138281 [Amanita thiersii Skay4041]|uniref:Molybdopterin synthase sulfur carrier subunit n=1 Tax=Amanita thiersii Skay4041 TaxID=703135 RepID=A0A2A9NYJ3_9AGAR|nr:hypothetical protein AMATHDRAFT_138281 [Amanita thiersii Skay4041]